MGFKKYFLLIVFLLLVPGVYSLTASIGNARMVLRTVVEEGEITTISKSIQINNVNNVPVKINARADQNLEDIVTISNPEFVIEPGETKYIDFTVALEYGGRYEGKIIVGFASADPNSKETGVGLSSTIIIIAEGPENPNPKPTNEINDTIPPPILEDNSSIDTEEINDDISSNEENNNEIVDDIDKESKVDKDDITTTTESPKPNPIIGVGLILAILAIGVGIFFLINRRG